MANNQMNSPKSFEKGRSKDKYLALQFIVNQIEKGTGLTISELKNKYSEFNLFAVALKHVTTTKKALCTAIDIPIEGSCRYKRTLEKEGHLVQSIDAVICPFNKSIAHEISTNPIEFERLRKSNNPQLNLFDNDRLYQV